MKYLLVIILMETAEERKLAIVKRVEAEKVKLRQQLVLLIGLSAAVCTLFFLITMFQNPY